MLEVTLLPGAEEDYRDALRWYSERSSRAAAAFEASIEVALQRVAENPERWSSCDSQHRFYILRKFPFSIVYRIEQTEVIVVAIAHGSRDQFYWRDRTTS